MNTRPLPRRPLTSLDAWPGEAAQPPLRLLESPGRRPAAAGPLGRDRPPSWLQRLRLALQAV